MSTWWKRKSKFEPPHDKTNKMTMHPKKTQISLGIRPVWSESSLWAQWVAKEPSFLHADSLDTDQTGQMPRLFWVFARRTVSLLVLSWGDSFIYGEDVDNIILKFLLCHCTVSNCVENHGTPGVPCCENKIIVLWLSEHFYLKVEMKMIKKWESVVLLILQLQVQGL